MPPVAQKQYHKARCNNNEIMTLTFHLLLSGCLQVFNENLCLQRNTGATRTQLSEKQFNQPDMIQPFSPSMLTHIYTYVWPQRIGFLVGI